VVDENSKKIIDNVVKEDDILDKNIASASDTLPLKASLYLSHQSLTGPLRPGATL
jgi:hypothetical protein